MNDIKPSVVKTVTFPVTHIIERPTPGETSLFKGTPFIHGKISRVLLAPGAELLSMTVGGEPRRVGDVLMCAQDILLTVKQPQGKPFIAPALVLMEAFEVPTESGGSTPDFHEYPLGLTLFQAQDRVALLPGQRLTLRVNMTSPTRPTLLEMESDSEGDVFVENVLYGRNSILCSPDKMAVEHFVKMPLHAGALYTGSQFKIEIKNESAVQRHVQAQLTGVTDE